MKAFERLKVFENKKINQYCDKLTNHFGRNNLLICGSVSRILFGGNFMQPKDIDFVAKNDEIFTKVQNELTDIFPHYKIENSKNRSIIYANECVIEIWKRNPSIDGQEFLYKNLIKCIISKK